LNVVSWGAVGIVGVSSFRPHPGRERRRAAKHDRTARAGLRPRFGVFLTLPAAAGLALVKPMVRRYNSKMSRTYGTALPRWSLLFAVAASGACALAAEVLWVRMLGLIFGNTTYAVSIVLAAFMAGASLGGRFFGGLSDRQRSPLRLLGWMLAGFGLYCLGVPLLLSGIQMLYVGSVKAWGGSAGLLRFFLTFLGLLVPTALAGGIVPVACKVREPGGEGVLAEVGWFYSANNLGAMGGALAAGYLLIELLGVRGALYAAASVSIAAGAAMLWLSPRYRTGGAALPAGPTSAPAATVLAGLAVTGFSAMVCQVAWTRALTMAFGSSVYAFSLMLGAFLGGIGAGGFLIAAAGDRRLRGAASRFFSAPSSGNPFPFGGLQAAVGLAVLVTVPVFGYLPAVLLEAVGYWNGAGIGFDAARFVIAFGAMLVPATLFGAAPPLGAWIAAAVRPEDGGGVSRVGGFGTRLGSVFGANAAGAVVGSVIAGFILVPYAGLQGSLYGIGLLNVFWGAGLMAFCRTGTFREKISIGLPAAISGVLLASFLPRWESALVSSGVYQYGPRFVGAASLRQLAKGREMLYYKEGAHFTVSVARNGKKTSVAIDGKTDASNDLRGDMFNQVLVGHLPVLAHPDPKSALVIGLASGVSLGAVARHPLETIDCVEIEPAMVEASRFFDAWNHRPLEDPRVRLVIEDARNWLLVTDRRYDILVSEPSNLWVAGQASLFTSEFYALAKARLRPGGIFCQWLHLYHLRPEDLRTVARTFSKAFPYATLWQAHHGDVLFLGSMERLDLAPASFERGWKDYDAAADLGRIGIQAPRHLLARLLLGPEAVPRFAGDAPLNTDDNARLEFSAPKSLFSPTVGPNLAAISRFRTMPEGFRGDSRLVDCFIARGAVLRASEMFYRGNKVGAYAGLSEAAKLCPGDGEARTLLFELLDRGGTGRGRS